MSQPSTPFDTSTADPFLPLPNQEQLSQADFHELFGPGTSDGGVFLPGNSEAFDGLNLTYESVSLVPVDSSSLSTISTPDFSSYSFGQHSPTYPAPESNIQHPYPLELDQTYEANTHQQTFRHRPLPIRSHTNNVHLHSAQVPQFGHRRRSLSHSDIDRPAAVTHIPNPTFFRLQAPRARTTTAEEYRRNESYSCGRSTSQGSPRGRPVKPRSTPYSLQSSPLVGGMLPTPIGTPLNEVMGVDDTSSDTDIAHQFHSIDMTGLPILSSAGNPIFRQMLHPDELARSRQIIEIGALAVTTNAKVDPRLEQGSSTLNLEHILKKLVDIEEHLEKSGGVEALRSCRTIREALVGEAESGKGMRVMDEGLIEGNGTSSNYSRMFDGCDDNEIMAMLMRQHGTGGSEVV